MKKKWVTMYLDICDIIAEESYANRLKVGALFLSPEGVMSIGINGLPSGGSNVCEREIIEYDDDSYITNSHLKTLDEVSHAEMNLFSKLMKQGVSTKDGTIFVSHRPCINCSKVIVGSGVKLVIYRSPYGSDAGEKWLKFNNIDCYKESEYGSI